MKYQVPYTKTIGVIKMKIKPQDFEELIADGVVNKYGKDIVWSDICKKCSNNMDKRFKYNLEDHASDAHHCLIKNCKNLADFYITFS